MHERRLRMRIVVETKHNNDRMTRYDRRRVPGGAEYWGAEYYGYNIKRVRTIYDHRCARVTNMVIDPRVSDLAKKNPRWTRLAARFVKLDKDTRRGGG